MKHTNLIIKSLLFLLIATFSVGCLSLQSTERAAIVIFNDTSSVIQYQMILSKNSSDFIAISEKEFDYAYEYETEEKVKVIPEELSQINFITITCKFTLNRSNLNNILIIDPEGRNTLNLHITDKLIKRAGCT